MLMKNVLIAIVESAQAFFNLVELCEASSPKKDRFGVAKMTLGKNLCCCEVNHIPHIWMSMSGGVGL